MLQQIWQNYPYPLLIEIRGINNWLKEKRGKLFPLVYTHSTEVMFVGNRTKKRGQRSGSKDCDTAQVPHQSQMALCYISLRSFYN